MVGGGPYNLGFRNGSLPVVAASLCDLYKNGSKKNMLFRYAERMKRILVEAQDHWLEYDDVIEILKNYQNADISAEHPNKPASGSVFLFDRKALRNFRKDRHNWIRNKHRKEPRFTLKIGVDSLRFSYARGEDNENLERRTYWLLERDLKHIVFVHYLEVKPVHLVSHADKAASTSKINSSFSSRFHGTSPVSTLSSAYEDAKSEDSHKARSRFHSYPESPLTDESHYSQSSSYNPLSRPGEIAFRH